MSVFFNVWNFTTYRWALLKKINPKIEKTNSSQSLLQYAPKQVAPVRLLAHFGQFSCGQASSIQTHIVFDHLWKWIKICE